MGSILSQPVVITDELRKNYINNFREYIVRRLLNDNFYKRGSIKFNVTEYIYHKSKLIINEEKIREILKDLILQQFVMYVSIKGIHGVFLKIMLVNNLKI